MTEEYKAAMEKYRAAEKRHRIMTEDFRLLAEHFTGSLNLSRLQLISISLRAMQSRGFTLFQQGDIAYALMTVLAIRPAMDPTDSALQALARLSISNDSDRIVERMACMQYPQVEGKSGTGWFGTDDELGANLWDIEPLCQVAGVCKDESIILDGCHGISIRWKDIPRIYSIVRDTWKKELAGLALRTGPYWFLAGCALVGIPGYQAGGAFLLIVGLILLLVSPFTITTLYGGKVWGAKPWLVGFEGTLPLERIEKLTFGNCIGRLTWTPSSGPYCSRDEKERIGVDPAENIANKRLKNEIPPNHRLFTLVDTGTMTVTVFSAVRPPSVALLCGKEGGMLRAVLCSYERSTDTLHKECVLRMETPMWDMSDLMSWVKLG